MMDSLDIETLDPGIRAVVTWLREAHFETVDSGDGVSKRGTPQEECMMDSPNVAVLVSPEMLIEECSRLATLLLDLGVRLGPTREQLREFMGGVPKDTPCGDGVLLEGVYLPFGGVSLIHLRGLDDKLFWHCQERKGHVP